MVGAWRPGLCSPATAILDLFVVALLQATQDPSPAVETRTTRRFVTSNLAEGRLRFPQFDPGGDYRARVLESKPGG